MLGSFQYYSNSDSGSTSPSTSGKRNFGSYCKPQIHLYKPLEVCSNFSLFFFLFHFHGLNNRPNAENRLFCSIGGDLEDELKVVVLIVPFDFLAIKKGKKTIKTPIKRRMRNNALFTSKHFSLTVTALQSHTTQSHIRIIICI